MSFEMSKIVGFSFKLTFFIIYSHALTILALDKRQEIIQINDENWSQMLEGEWLVDFYAPWCPACQSLEPEWQKLAGWADDLNIKVASADVTAHPGLSGRFLIGGLPTIYHVKEGLFRIYNGRRDHTELISFIEEQAWKKIEPVSKIWSPESFQMSAFASFFKFSMLLRDFHAKLADTFGIPPYISYIIFAILTVTLSIAFSALIVFLVDFLTVKNSRLKLQKTTKEKKASSDETNIDEEFSESEVHEDSKTK